MSQQQLPAVYHNTATGLDHVIDPVPLGLAQRSPLQLGQNSP